jgi:hypothetical protein
MPACPYGASPKPGLPAGTEAWLDKSGLPLEIIDLMTLFMKSAWASITAQLVSPLGICAENPEPPAPITVEDVIGQTGGPAPFPGAAQGYVIAKIYAWLRYQQFLLWCDCNPPPTTPGNNCAAAPASFPLGPLGSIAGPFPVSIDQAVLDSWFVYPDGDWVWGYQGSASVSGDASTGDDLDIQFQAANGTWVAGPDLFTLNANSSSCSYPIYQSSVPRIGTTSAIRLVNNAGGTYTITNLAFCFCPSLSVPPPLPTQPPFTDVPAPPALLCGTDDLCAMVTELSHRLTVVAAQISDLQASLTGTDVLTVLSEHTMGPEGQLDLALGTRAVSVELIELGDDAYTSALGNPRGLMRVGSLRWWDGVGYSPRRFIDADRYDENRPPGALAVSWQLLPGTIGILKFLG